MPFRDAHAVVGDLVRRSIDGGEALDELVAGHPDLGPQAAALLAAGVAVTRRTTPGGAGPGPVADQVVRFRARLVDDRQRVGDSASS